MRITSTIAILVILISCSVTKSTNTLHSFHGKEIGCGKFIVYKLTKDNDEYVSVSFSIAQVELAESQSYGIGKADVVEVKRRKFNGLIDSSLCNDVMSNKPEKVLDETASSGLVEILLSEEDIAKSNNREPFEVTVILKDVQFEGATIDYLRIEKITVGWLPG